MASLRRMSDVNLSNKRVLIREDLNVPMEKGEITNDLRLRAALPTIQDALKREASVILISHLGRPSEGQIDKQFSLEPVARRLSELLKKPVQFMPEWLEGVKLLPGQVALCENVRFNVGEENNDEDLAKKMAKLCDIFVMDAFATAHRIQASTYGVAEYAPVTCAGPLLLAEIEALNNVMKNPKHPLIAILGGSKISTKIIVIKELLQIVDQLIPGGGIANTLLAAKGLPVGKSLYEKDMLDVAKEILDFADKQGVAISLPTDVVVAKECSATATPVTKKVTDVADDDMILDIGPQTVQQYAKSIGQAGTILWNGPLGVFEIPAFAEGTQRIAKAIAGSSAYSVAGGGDTLAAIEKYGLAHALSYISTGGGAFLEYIEGKSLPALDVIQQRSSE